MHLLLYKISKFYRISHPRTPVWEWVDGDPFRIPHPEPTPLDDLRRFTLSVVRRPAADWSGRALMENHPHRQFLDPPLLNVSS